LALEGGGAAAGGVASSWRLSIAVKWWSGGVEEPWRHRALLGGVSSGALNGCRAINGGILYVSNVAYLTPHGENRVLREAGREAGDERVYCRRKKRLGSLAASAPAIGERGAIFNICIGICKRTVVNRQR